MWLIFSNKKLYELITAIHFSTNIDYNESKVKSRFAAYASERIWIFFFTFAYKNTKVFSTFVSVI